ncbi:MAG: tetratricopeptide repeat protein [Ignavibacteria bacterium]|nr:tetratricopeptide repeat protein [Ignavibacteria bacterium]
MVLNTHQGSMLALSWRIIGLAALFALLLVGCAASEETAEGEKQSADQQALTNLVGGARPEVRQPSPEPTPGATEALLEDLRTENTGLKQKLMKMEQDMRGLTVRINETEARLLAEKERAEKAETTARSLAQPTSQARSAQPAGTGALTEASLAAYQDALTSFNNKQYDDAIARFQALLNSGVSVELADNCTYWIGESYFGKRNFREALPYFEKVLEFEGSPKLADAHYMIGQSHERLGDKAKAKASYEKVIKDFPVSGNVKRAKDRLAKL